MNDFFYYRNQIKICQEKLINLDFTIFISLMVSNNITQDTYDTNSVWQTQNQDLLSKCF